MSADRSTPTDLVLRKARHVVPMLILVGVVLGFAVLFYQVVRPLLLPLFLAAVLALLAGPWQERLTARFGGRGWLAALVLTLFGLLAVLGPLTTASWLAVGELRRALHELQELSSQGGLKELLAPDHNPQLAAAVQWIKEKTGLDDQEVRGGIVKLATDSGQVLYRRTVDFVSNLPGLVIGFLMFILAFYFFLKDRDKIEKTWEQLSPMDDEHDRVIREEFAKVCRGVVWGTIAAALAQGVLFGLGLFILDMFSSADVGRWTFLLSILTVGFAMIPFFGAAAVWIPTALALFLQGHHSVAIILALYGALVVSQVDTIIKVYALKDRANLHPLMVFVCVFGGMELFGILGIFIGPIVGAVLVALLRILKREILQYSRGEAVAPVKSG